MRITDRNFLRGLLLSGIYTLGILGIVASGGGGGGGDDNYNCDLRVENISPATDGSGDIWIDGEIAARLVSGAEPDELLKSVVRLRSDGTEAARYVVEQGESQQYSIVVWALAASTDGSGDVYVGGDFSKGIMRLNRDGTVDPGFSTGSGFADGVIGIVPATDGSGDVYVSGRSTYDNNPFIGNLVRLDNDGMLDAGFDPSAFGTINAEAIDGSYDIFASGQSGYEVLWRLKSDGTPVPGFTNIVYPPQPQAPRMVAGFALAADIDQGDFYTGWEGEGTINRFNSNGSLDPDFSSGGGIVYSGYRMNIASAMDGTGAIYVGDVSTYDGNPAKEIVRLNRDGSLDVNFITGSGFDSSDGIYTIASAQDGTGDVYAGGFVRFYNGSKINGIVRLNADGSLDTDFDVRISSTYGICNKDTNR